MQPVSMRVGDIHSCYIGPEISPEQFIPEHFFLYLAKGNMEGYDGHRRYHLKAGEYCLVRKNQLARYNKQREEGVFEKVIVVFEESFLRAYQEKYKVIITKTAIDSAFIRLQESKLLTPFIHSLKPYYNEQQQINAAFLNVKREELLTILLESNPGLAGILFDFREPEKINLEAYMNRNYTFNVSISRFAYLTGRSLSAFKRDFAAIFADTPSRWLVQRRLREAHFLIDKKGKKPADIYLDLGFEDLSHFSFAFKKKYGVSPTGLGQDH